MKFAATLFALSFFVQADEVHDCKVSVTSIREPEKCALFCSYYAWAQEEFCDKNDTLTDCVLKNHPTTCHRRQLESEQSTIKENQDVIPEAGVTAEDITACEWLVNESSWFMFPSFCRPYCQLYAQMYSECRTSLKDLASCVMENIYCSHNTGCHGLTEDLPECLDYEIWEWPEQVDTRPWSMSGMISPWQTCRPGALAQPTGPMTWDNKYYIKKCKDITRHSAAKGSVEKCHSLCEWVVTEGRKNYDDFESRAAVAHHVWDLMPECNVNIDCEYLGTLLTPPRNIHPKFLENFKDDFKLSH